MKNIIALLLTALMLLGALTGCGEKAVEAALRDGVDLASEIEIVCVIPTGTVEDAVIENNTWNKFVLYTNKAEFRAAVDAGLQINTVDIEGVQGKVGILSVDSAGFVNFANSYREVLGNKAFYTSENLAALEAAVPDGADMAERLGTLSNYFNIFDADTDEIAANALVSRQAFLEALYRFDNQYSEVVNSDLEELGALGITEPSLSQSMASVNAGNGWLRPSSGEATAELFGMNITKFEVLYSLMARYFPNELAAGIAEAKGMIEGSEGFDGSSFVSAFTDVKSVTDIGTEERVRLVNEEGALETADGYRALVLSKQLEKTDGAMDYELYGTLLAANKLGLVQGNINVVAAEEVAEGGSQITVAEVAQSISGWNSAVTQQDVAKMFVSAILASNMENGFASDVTIANADYTKEFTEEQYIDYVNAMDAGIVTDGTGILAGPRDGVVTVGPGVDPEAPYGRDKYGTALPAAGVSEQSAPIEPIENYRNIPAELANHVTAESLARDRVTSEIFNQLQVIDIVIYDDIGHGVELDTSDNRLLRFETPEREGVYDYFFIAYQDEGAKEHNWLNIIHYNSFWGFNIIGNV